MANLETLELPGIPKRVDCLAWSEDGELAIAISDQIFIFSPNRSSKTTKSDETTWHRIQFTAGTFTLKEWPESAPENMLNMHVPYIGREQAPAEVVSMQWSPPGIAPRFRCALAVLTTNYLLSIWTRTSDSSLETKWIRQCVLNASISQDLPPIVAMGWSPIVDGNRLYKTKQAVPPAREPLAWKYYLAVVLQDMKLVILNITTPYRTQRFGTVSLHTSANFPDSAIAARNDSTLCYNTLVHPESPLLGTYFHGVDWTQYQYTPKSAHVKGTIVTRAYNEDVRWSVSVETEGDIKLGQPWNLKQEPDLRHANGTDSIWSGTCMVCPIRGHPNGGVDTDHICLSTQEYTLECYRLVNGKRGRTKVSIWKPCTGLSRLDEEVKKLKQEYSEKLSPRGPVDVHVWGLASHGPFIALCLTLHPAHLLQYITPGKFNFHVLFSHKSLEAVCPTAADEDGEAIQFPWMTPGTTDKNDFEARSGPLPPCIPPVANELSSIRMNAQLTLTILISSLLQQNPEVSWLSHVDAVLARYAKLQDSASGLTDLLSFIQSARLSQDKDFTPTVLTKYVNEFIQARASFEAYSAASSQDASTRIIEYCPTPGCKGPVFWSTQGGASCAQGHRQTRCALTALALLNPYVIKRCETCTRAYLDETHLELFYADSEAASSISQRQREQPLTQEEEEDSDGVAWLLKAVTCIYCGGKFTRYV